MVAVTGQSWLRAVWAEEEVKITNSKADYMFVDATAAQRLPKPPAQPSEAQLLELLTDMQAIYEARTSKHVQGAVMIMHELCIDLFFVLCILVTFTFGDITKAFTSCLLQRKAF